MAPKRQRPAGKAGRGGKSQSTRGNSTKQRERAEAIDEHHLAPDNAPEGG